MLRLVPKNGSGTTLAVAAVVLALAFLLPLATVASAATDSGSHALVRYWLDSPADLAFLHAHPGLDIVHSKPGYHVDIVASPRYLEIISRSGGRFDIVHEDVEAFLRSRLPAERSDSFGIYHNWTEQVAFVDSLRLLYPGVVSEKWSLGLSHEGRDIWCFRMSDNPDLDEGEPEILFDGIHHAREPMSGEFCIMFAEYLAQNYGSDPEVTWLLDNREVYFVPCVNPDGYWYNNWGDMWRKNRRNNGGGCWGVDPNRNYPYMWGYDNSGSSPDPCEETYRGPSAGSEPEVQAIMNLVAGHQFVTRNSYHTYSNLTLFPWGYINNPTPDDAIFEHMGQIMTMYNGYTPGQCPETLGYYVNGGSFDWDYGDTGHHTRIWGFTNEIGNSSDFFWPPESRRGDLFQENIWPAIYLMRAAAAFIDVSQPAVLGGDLNGRLDAGESAGLSFLVENQGVTATAQNVTITLSSDDPYLQLGEAYRSLGDLGPFGTVDFAADPFDVTVDAACPTGHLIAVTATVTQQDGSFDYVFNFQVGAPTVVYSTDFDFGSAGWTLTHDWGITSAQSHSPPSCLTDSPGDDYADQTVSSATLDQGYLASSLSFWHRYEIEEDWDYGYVKVSADGGPWTTLATYTGFQMGWTQVTLPLDDYVGQEVRIRFELFTDTWVNEDGWFIDDVALYGFELDNVPPPPPSLVSPAPGATVDATPTLTVTNSYDPDGPGPVTYGFRIYGDELCTSLAAAADDIAEGASQTSWTAPTLADGTYWWRACAADPSERGLLGEKRSFDVSGSTAVGDGLILRPLLAVLGPPTDGRARIRLDLPAATAVDLSLFDARGWLVRRLHAGPLQAGSRILTWDGRDSAGRAVASGLYFVHLRAGDFTLTDRIVMVR